MTQKEDIHQIDLERVIKSKNPRLLKLLPKFVLKYIKKIIHQEEFNDFLVRTKDIYNHDFISEALRNFQIKVTSTGLENIPAQGPCIIVCNHPLGGIDGIAVMHEVGKRRKDQKALVNDLLMNLENMNSLLIPINKHGKNAVQNIKKIDQTYAGDGCVIVFPAGLVSRKQKGVIMDLEWKKSFVAKAIQYKLPVIPVHIEAQNSKFFYNLALFRKSIGVKTNIEMFYLVDEVYKQKGKMIKLTFGKTIPYESFTKSYSHLQWSNKVKEYVYKLKENQNQEWLS